MSKPTHILMVEDLITDAELAEHEIRKAVKDCEFRIVETREDYLDALENFRPDLILSDYHLPSFDGMTALELALKHTPLTPLIIWTGSLSEDVAVSCMKAGANNYVLKNNIKRLVPAILHALDERHLLLERKQAEEALQNNEKRFRALIENGLDSISLLAADGALLWESPAAYRILDYEHNQFLGHDIFELVHPDDMEWVSNLFVKLVQDPEGQQHGVFRLRHSNGKWRWVEAIASNMLDDPNVSAIVVNYRDITERKQAEEALRESEKRLVLALSAAQMGVWEWDLQTNDISWSPEFFEIEGINQNASGGTFASPTSLIHPADIDRIKTSAQKALSEKTLFAEEFRIIRPDGKVRWLSNLGQAEYDPSGKHLLLIGTVQDVTERKQAEMERQVLLEIMQGLANTTDLQELLELVHASISRMILAEDFFVVFYNPKTGLFEDIYSVDSHGPPQPPTKLEKSITSYVFRSAQPLLLTRSRREELVEQGEIELFGTNPKSWLGAPLKTSDRTIGVMAMQDYEHPNRYSEHDRNFLASIATQVALAIEHREAGTALRESEKRYRVLFEDMPIAIWEEDFSQVKKYLNSLRRQGVTDFREYFASHPEIAIQCGNMVKVLDVNNAAVEMFQANSKEELIRIANGEPSKGEQENNLDDLIMIADGELSHSWEGSDETCTGDPMEINLSWSVAPGYENDYSRVIVTTNDITQRKKSEASLKLFRTLIDRSNDAIEVFDPETFRFIDINEKACQDLGYSREELLSLTIFDIDPTFEFSSSPEFIQALQESGFVIMESLHQRKDGSTFPVELNMKYTQLDMAYVVAISRDITERKKTEMALLESNLQFRTLFEASPEAIMLIDPHDNWPVLDCNTAACHMNGFTREELIGQSIDILNLTPVQPGERIDYMERIHQAGVLRYETSYRHKNGAVFPVEVSTCLITLGGRQVVLGIDRDITERKRAEQALRESEALYRQAIEVAGAVPYYESYYGDGNLIKYEFIGEGIRQITGYGPEEFNAKIWDSLVEDVNLVEELDGYSLTEGIQRVRSGKNPIWKCEHRLRDRYGKIHWVFEAAVELRDEQGVLTRLHWHLSGYHRTETGGIGATRFGRTFRSTCKQHPGSVLDHRCRERSGNLHESCCGDDLGSSSFQILKRAGFFHQ